ncbi:MAG TPA: type IV pilus twitching motility protein PilT [Polyangiaceae bacterium]|nr:type IV pilus twitching motility protein PilT [Polyangiaceae bacterium]
MTLSVQRLLRFALDLGASDLHVSAGDSPMLRISGDLVRVDVPPLSAEGAHQLVFQVMNDLQRRTFQEHQEVDFAYALEDNVRFRVNAFVQNRGEGAVFRLIPSKIPRLEELGLPPILKTLSDAEKGLVLVTGPTGSGKSTTLAAMINYINGRLAGHILTLEDPIEFVHPPRRCLISQREVGSQTKSFNAALRSALREDPDVILVGELRDLETTQLALTAAETGHLVLATLHTASAPKTIDRIIDIFPPEQQAQIRVMLSESLIGVVAQMLVKKKGGGRVGVLEVLMGTPAVRNLIREGKTHQILSTMQVGQKSGMQTMEATLVNMVMQGVVSLAEARIRMPDSEVLGALAAQATSGSRTMQGVDR